MSMSVRGYACVCLRVCVSTCLYVCASLCAYRTIDIWVAEIMCVSVFLFLSLSFSFFLSLSLFLSLPFSHSLSFIPSLSLSPSLFKLVLYFFLNIFGHLFVSYYRFNFNKLQHTATHCNTLQNGGCAISQNCTLSGGGQRSFFRRRLSKTSVSREQTLSQCTLF